MALPSLTDQFEISCIHCVLNPLFLAGEGPILEVADIILHDEFFGRIEVTHIKDRQIRLELKKRAAVCKVKTTFLAQPTIFRKQLNFHSVDAVERDRAFQEMTVCLREADEMEADSLTMCSGPMDDTEETDAFLYYREFVEKFHRQADAMGIRILLEPFDDTLDKKRFFGASDKVIRWLDQLGRYRHFALLVDLSHIPLLGETIEETVQKLGKHMGHIHIGNAVLSPDNERFGDSHPYFGYPGGANDARQVALFLQSCQRSGYMQSGKRATLGMELIPQKNERASDMIMNGKRTLLAAWREVQEQFVPASMILPGFRGSETI